MGEKRIDCYLDLASFFSHVAIVDLLSNLDKLTANGVTVEFHPVLLGGINSLSGNKPPWTLEAKAKYLVHDSKRACNRVGIFNYQTPDDLMAVSHTVSPLRALHYIKANYPAATFHAAFLSLFRSFWTPPNLDLMPDANLRKALVQAADDSGRTLFTEAEVDKIMAARAGLKDKLLKTTAKAVELGAFGAPWLWVTNGRGESQPFFGSDRFNHIYKYLEIPFQDVAVLAPSKL